MANITIDSLPALTALDGKERIPLAKFNGIGWTTQYTTTGAVTSLQAQAPYVMASASVQFPTSRVMAATSGQTTLTDAGAGSTLSFGLATTGVTAGTYGDSTHTLTAAVDAYGRITGLTAVSIAYPSTFATATFSTSAVFNGATSGSTTVVATAAASGTLTLPAATDTLVGRATTDTLTNKTLTSPVMTGTPTAPTQTASDNSTKIATTAYADAGDALKLSLSGGTMTGAINVNGQAISKVATLNGGPLGGVRNKVINGDFFWWNYATTQTSAGYGSADRWYNWSNGSTKTVSQQSFTLGQTAVPGNPVFFSRTVVTSVAGAGNLVYQEHRIERADMLAGAQATLTFYAKADASRNMCAQLYQNFGSGGSSSVNFAITTIALTTSWQRFDVVTTVPSISGKVYGGSGTPFLGITFWYDAGSNFNSSTNSLGQQSGTFDIARVCLNEGDCSKEADPYERRTVNAESLLCDRYYQYFTNYLVSGYGATAGGFIYQEFALPIEMCYGPNVTYTASPTYTNASAITTSQASWNHLRVRITATAIGFGSAATSIFCQSEI